ncbi:hypothetical protein GPECTOR_5g7 [Gonium pectorale]|uniref:Cleavage/polyadenylation specificity factor A subunit N-terminal domain-containing protein n=1 Tax=Gonium pectorale TaxID=33097 RepID=A0A150GX84_GONPE|nr:hypothetical protein GPECTOR_5g7 [Gonium pectorale]|eukprot:KXZ54415.1 hypothetical protein GPECTOR_5g7 [Gonium pectorale]
MRARPGGHSVIKAQLRTYAIPAPGVRAVAVRPNPRSGLPQPLVVCQFGICPLHFEDDRYVRLEPPLELRNVPSSAFSTQRVYDAVFDAHSGQVIFAHGTSLYGMDAENRLERLAGDDAGALIGDGPAADARFVGVQRITCDGAGITYIRDRDNASRNGFCLRLLHEASMPAPAPASDPPLGTARRRLVGSGIRAVVSVRTNYDVGPQAMTYDPVRQALLFTTRGRAVHALRPHGLAEPVLGSEDAPAPAFACRAASHRAAIASASASDASSESDDPNALCYTDTEPAAAAVSASGYESDLAPARAAAAAAASAAAATRGAAGAGGGGRLHIANIQALAADSAATFCAARDGAAGGGDVYLLEGVSTAFSRLLALRPDGDLVLLAERLAVAPPGGSHWPRLAALGGGHLAVYGSSSYDMMMIRL